MAPAERMILKRWQQVVRDGGDRPAVLWDGGSMSFRQLDAEARERSRSDRGGIVVAQGDPPELVVKILAGWMSRRPVQLVEKDRQPRVPASEVPLEACLIKQTVGGSGVRRCQFFTAAQLLADVDRLHQALELRERGVALATLSQAHSYGLTVGAMQTLFHGVPIHWVANPFPTVVAEMMGVHERVFLAGVPAMWKAWLMGGLPMRNVALAVSAGSPLTLELEMRARDHAGIKLHNLYGASECGAISYDATDQPREDASDLGQVLSGVGVACGSGGRLRVESDAVGLGYDALLQGEVFGSGVFETQDVVRHEGDGLFLEACQGGGINVAGRKLSPGEIASKIAEANGLPLDTVTIKGRPSRDPERCEEVAAVIAGEGMVLDEAFRLQATQHLAPWEFPRVWRMAE
jgi:acyl-coenzyme A synthetase/AMP-(fatty) acid ligase